MSLETEYRSLLKLIKHDGKKGCKGYKGLAKAIKMPYSTLLILSKGDSPGAIKSWLRIERFYNRQNK